MNTRGAKAGFDWCSVRLRAVMVAVALMSGWFGGCESGKEGSASVRQNQVVESKEQKQIRELEEEVAALKTAASEYDDFVIERMRQRLRDLEELTYAGQTPNEVVDGVNVYSADTSDGVLVGNVLAVLESKKSAMKWVSDRARKSGDTIVLEGYSYGLSDELCVMAMDPATKITIGRDGMVSALGPHRFYAGLEGGE